MMGVKTKQAISATIVYVVLSAGAVVMIVPLLWTISTSLKTLQQLVIWPPEWIPDPVAWENYVEIFHLQPLVLYFRNSLFIVVANVLGGIITCSFVAYGFARIQFPGRDAIFVLLLSTMMMPYIVRLIPLFIIYHRINWIGTFLPLVVPPLLGRSPFYIFLLRQFLLGIPNELSDAARIDGCNDLGIWLRIIVPLTKPALAAVAIFSFQGAWGNFLAPLIYLGNKPEFRPLAVGLYYFHAATHDLPETHYLMAMSTLMILPVMMIFALGQQYFIRGVTFSGLKG